MRSSPQSYRLWNPPVPHQLDEVTGHIVDITAAHAFLQRLLVLSQSPVVDSTAIEALSIAAVVRYCRCFTSGSRAKLSITDLNSATQEELDLHEHIRGVRDWHIAHPVNQQEVHAVHLIVGAGKQGEPIVVGASSFNASEFPLDSVQARQALSLTEKWIVLLKARIVEEQLRLRPYAQALSPTQLLALPELSPEPNPDIRARRKQSKSR